MKPTQVYWTEVNGSIFTEDKFEVKLESGKRVMQQISIAFNVGREIAKHIVYQHNKKITELRGDWP